MTDIKTLSAVTMIVSAEVAPLCRGIDDLERRVKTAMSKARDHWMTRSEQEQMLGALVAAMETSPDEVQKEQIASSSRTLHKWQAWLSAALQGVAGDPPEVPEGTLPLMEWWRSTKNGGR